MWSFAKAEPRTQRRVILVWSWVMVAILAAFGVMFVIQDKPLLVALAGVLVVVQVVVAIRAPRTLAIEKFTGSAPAPAVSGERSSVADDEPAR